MLFLSCGSRSSLTGIPQAIRPKVGLKPSLPLISPSQRITVTTSVMTLVSMPPELLQKIFSELDDASSQQLLRASNRALYGSALNAYYDVHICEITTLDTTLLNGPHPSLLDLPSLSHLQKALLKKVRNLGIHGSGLVYVPLGLVSPILN